MKRTFLEKLAAATPSSAVIKWLVFTMLYAFVMVVNEHFDLIAALQLPARTETMIRLSGVYIYIILTAYQFQKTNNNEEHNNYPKVPPLMGHTDLHNDIFIDKGSQDTQQRDRENGQQPTPVATEPAGNPAQQWQDSKPGGGIAPAPEGTD